MTPSTLLLPPESPETQGSLETPKNLAFERRGNPGCDDSNPFCLDNEDDDRPWARFYGRREQPSLVLGAEAVSSTLADDFIGQQEGSVRESASDTFSIRGIAKQVESMRERTTRAASTMEDLPPTLPYISNRPPILVDRFIPDPLAV